MDDLTLNVAPTITTVVVSNPDPKRDPAELRSAAQVLKVKAEITQMTQDGLTVEQIATALGYPTEQVAVLLAEKVDVGTPEQVLQEALRTVVSLIPIADTVYRGSTNNYNALTLTGFIDAARNLIQDLSGMRDKETLYLEVVQRALQPMVRRMIKELMVEVRNEEEFERETFVTNLGVKFQETYRKAVDELANIIGVSSIDRARVLAGIALSKE